LFRRLVNSRKQNDIIQISVSVGALRRVSLQTKKIKGPHENGFVMATKIDRIFACTSTG